MLFPLLIGGATNGFAADTNAALTMPEFQVATAREYLHDLSQALAAQLGTNTESLFTRARLCSQLGEKDEAEVQARQALELQTNRADIAVFIAQILIRKDQMDEAAAVLQKAVQANPAINGGQRLLGMVFDRLGKPEEAEAAFRAAVKVNAKDANACLVLGRFLLDHGSINEAVTNLERACQLDPELANAYYPLFQAQTKLGNKAAAQTALKKFNELKKVEKTGMGSFGEDLNFDNEGKLRAYAAGVHTEAGNVLRHQGKTDLAEAHFLQAIRIGPKEPLAYEALGELYSQNGRLEDARKALEKLAELRPDQLSTRVNLGTLLLQLKQYPAAIQELKRALELDPKQPQALYNLSRHYLSTRHDLPEALALAQRLVVGEPSGSSYDLLSWAFYANGRTNEAVQALSQAVEKSPENPVFRQRLERLKKAAGVNP